MTNERKLQTALFRRWLTAYYQEFLYAVGVLFQHVVINLQLQIRLGIVTVIILEFFDTN